MKIQPSCLIGGLSMLILAMQMPAQNSSTAVSIEPLPEKYRIISQRNMFSSSRRAYQPRQLREQRTARAPEPLVDPGRHYVLRGVSRWDNQFIAFVEDTQYERISLIRLNEAVAEGTVVGMTLDHLEFRKGNKVARISIGEDFTGVARSTAESAIVDSPTEGFGSDASGTDATMEGTTEEQNELLRRLMERRRQEL